MKTVVVSVGLAGLLWMSACRSSRPIDQSDPQVVATAFCEAVSGGDVRSALVYTHPEMRSRWEESLRKGLPGGFPAEPEIAMELRADGQRANARILNFKPDGHPTDLHLKFEDGRWWVMK